MVLSEDEYVTAGNYDRLYMVDGLIQQMVDRIYADQNTNGTYMGWNTCRRMQSLNDMYIATGDTKYLDANLRLARATIANTDDKVGHYTFWGELAPGWGTDHYADRWVVHPVHTGNICTGLMDFLQLAPLEPSVMAQMDPCEYDYLVAETLEAIDWHDRQWIEGPETGAGYYISKDNEAPNEGDPLAFNRTSAMGTALWSAWELTGNTAYRDKAIKNATWIKNRIFIYDDGAYYWPGHLSVTVPTSRPAKNSFNGGDTLSYSGIDVTFPLRIGMAGYVFDDSDIEAFALTVINGFGRLDNGVLFNKNTGTYHWTVGPSGTVLSTGYFLRLAPYSREAYSRIVEYYRRYQKDLAPIDIAAALRWKQPGRRFGGDVNDDLTVDKVDLTMVSDDWLKCTDPANSDCDAYWDKPMVGANAPPAPAIYSPNPGLWCEFNDVNPTYGGPDDVSTWWDFSSEPGVGICPGRESYHMNSYYVRKLGLGTYDPMDTTEDWVVRIRMRRDASVAQTKVIECGAESGGVMQLDTLSTGQITVLYGPEEFNNWQTWTSPTVLLPLGEYKVLTLHYKASNGLLDLWVDDDLVFGDFLPKGDMQAVDLMWVGLRGSVSYDDLMVGELLVVPSVCGDAGTVYLAGDADSDCYVRGEDFAMVSSDWLANNHYDEFGNYIAAWWKFDEGVADIAFDSSGWVNNALVWGVGWTSGRDGGALDFDGLEHAYVCISSKALEGISDEITVMFWQYGDTTQPRGDYLFEATEADNDRVLGCHLPWSDGKVYWDAGNDGGSTYDRISKATTSASQYKGQWNHWAFTKNATTGYMRIYLNGSEWYSVGGEHPDDG